MRRSIGWALRALDQGATCTDTLPQRLQVNGVVTDSRKVKPGNLFVTLDGVHHRGSTFVADALARGAVGAITPHGTDRKVGLNAPLLMVADPLAALGSIATAYRRELRAEVVAITGSVGKTTTRELLRSLLSGLGCEVVSAEKSYNNAIGVPLTILRATDDTRYLLVEIGTNAPGEVLALGRIAQPDIAVITNVAPAHLEGLKTLAGVAAEKASLLKALPTWGVGVLNGNDVRVRAMPSEGHPRLLFGTEATHAVCVNRSGTSLQVAIRGGEPHVVPFSIHGNHNVLNAGAAIAATVALGLPLHQTLPQLAHAELPPQRLAVYETERGVVIDDTYNANPASVQAALDVLSSYPAPSRIAVLAGMHELGSDSVTLHREIGRYAASRTDVLITVGPTAMPIAAGALVGGMNAAQVLPCTDHSEALSVLESRRQPETCVLFKGSRCERLDELVAAFHKPRRLP